MTVTEGRPLDEIQERISTVRASLEQNLEEMARLRDSVEQNLQHTIDYRQLLTNSVLARMQARLESLPVIEQAKGVLMAQSGCSPEEAFQILRRASQRSNVRVRDIAADIVARAARRAQSGRAEPTSGNGRVARSA